MVLRYNLDFSWFWRPLDDNIIPIKTDSKVHRYAAFQVGTQPHIISHPWQDRLAKVESTAAKRLLGWAEACFTGYGWGNDTCVK